MAAAAVGCLSRAWGVCAHPPQGQGAVGRIWGSSAEAPSEARLSQGGHSDQPPWRHLCRALAPTPCVSWVTAAPSTLPPALSSSQLPLPPPPPAPALRFPGDLGPGSCGGPQARGVPPGLSTPVQGTQETLLWCFLPGGKGFPRGQPLLPAFGAAFWQVAPADAWIVSLRSPELAAVPWLGGSATEEVAEAGCPVLTPKAPSP